MNKVMCAKFLPFYSSCVKASLIQSVSSPNWTFCTHAIANTAKPTFGENFPLAVPKAKLASKTLQVNVWSVSADQTQGEEECLGGAQVSLADFDACAVSLRWYNILSYHFMRQPRESAHARAHAQQQQQQRENSKREIAAASAGSSRQGTLKEEGQSSDESTVISSQTSTLTRNVGPEEALLMGAAVGMVAATPVEGEIEVSLRVQIE